MRLSIESLGADGVLKLQQAVEALAREGGDAAPEFQQLADEIGRLGQQNQALTAFRTLADETDTLRARQEAAAQSSSEMAARLETLRAATEEARRVQAQVAKEYDDAGVAVVRATGAIRAYKAETDQGTKQTAEYRTTLASLVRTQAQAQETLKVASQTQRDANASLKEAERAQSSLEKQYTRSAAQTDRLAASLKEQETALRESAAAAEELGVSTSDIAASEGRLLTALQATAAKVEQRSAAVREMAEADRLAAIEEQGMIDLLRRGEQALQAEVLAQRDAARATQEYEEAKRAATEANAAWQREADEIVNAAEAARQLARETAILTAAQKELAAQRTFEQQAEAAQKLMRATEYVRFWETALEQAENQARETAEAATSAAQKIDDAFGTLGVRSIQQVEKEIADVRAAMATLGAAGTQTGNQLAGAFAAGEARIKTLEREIRELNGTLTLADRAANLFKNSLGQIAAGNLIADAIGSLVERVKELGRQFVTTIAQTERMRNALNAIYKDTEVAGAQFQFLRQTALDSGIAVSGLQSSFVKFSASMNSANIPIRESNELFAALTRAAGTLGLSSDEVSGSLEALSQMAGKGTVSMEELRQQLGDRLPGAFGLVAKGLGLTESSLVKLVESGGLAARDLFPALTQSLKDMQGEVTGLVPTYERLKTVLTGIATDAGDAGWTVILTNALKGLGIVLGTVGLALSVLQEGLFSAGRAAILFFETLRGNGAQALEYFNEESRKATDRLDQQALRLQALINPAGEAAQKLRDLAGQQTAVANSANVAAAGTTALAAVTTTSVTAQSALAAAMNTTAQTYVAARDAVQKMIAAAQSEGEAANKRIKAAQTEAATIEALAKIRGDERTALDAAVQASQAQVAATESRAAATQKETELLQVQRALLIDTANQRGITKTALEEEVKALDQKIEKSAAEAEASRNALTGLQLEIAARQQARQAYEDNSAAVDQLRAAMLAADAALATHQQLLSQGLVTQAQYNEAKLLAARATATYRDAVADATAKIDALSTVEQANYNVKRAGLAVQQQTYNLLADEARASGNYAQAAYYEIEARRNQIEVVKLQAEAKAKEAAATIKGAQAELEALKATNSLTEVKRLEIEARIANAKAKEIEAKGSEVTIRALESEIDVIRRRGVAVNGSTASTNANTAAIDANTAAISRGMDAREQEIEQKERKIALDEREAAVANKMREGSASMSSDVMTRTGIVNFLKQAGVDNEAIARQIANEFADSQGNIVYSNNPGQLKYGGQGSTLTQALLKAAETYTFSNQRSAPANAPGVQVPTAPVPTKDTTSGKTVTINIGGRSQNVRVASDQDANNLTSILRQLETQAGTAA